MAYAEGNMEISHIANYLVMNEGQQLTYQILSSYNYPYDPDIGESDNLELFIRYFYSESRIEHFPDVMTILIRNYRLNDADRERVEMNLHRLGYMFEDGIVIEVPQQDDFFKFLEECLRDPDVMRAEGGAYDGALLTLSEGLIEKDEDFTLIDYGCGEGRLLFALAHLPNVIRNQITYIGVDINEEYLDSLSKIIEDNEFENKFKSCTVMKVEDFFKAELTVEYIFMVNVLHEVPLNNLPKIIINLEAALKKDGILLIHEMRELVEGELRFISWDEEDVNELFNNTSLHIQIRTYNSRSGASLINVHLKREKHIPTDIDVIQENLKLMVENKLKRINDEIKEIEDSGDELKTRRFGYLLMLRHNVENQYSKFLEELE